MMSDIGHIIRELHVSLPEDVELVAVSKFHPVEALLEAYRAGQRVFGESRQQELIEKLPQMPSDVRWHFIGHLQTNKVRSIVGRVALIESVDTEKLLSVINAEAAKAGVVQPVLMQVHVAREETKFGFLPDELIEFFASGKAASYTSVRFRGVMGMASNTDDEERVRADFAAIRRTYEAIRATGAAPEQFDVISMGMSHDYKLAIAEGSNMVRIGTMIFGDRE